MKKIFSFNEIISYLTEMTNDGVYVRNSIQEKDDLVYEICYFKNKTGGINQLITNNKGLNSFAKNIQSIAKVEMGASQEEINKDLKRRETILNYMIGEVINAYLTKKEYESLAAKLANSEVSIKRKNKIWGVKWELKIIAMTRLKT